MVGWRQPQLVTPDEYLELERKANYKSEYLCGQIYAMSGGSFAHSTITLNIGSGIHVRLIGTPCQAFSTDAKVRTTPSGLFAYPDVTVVCGKLIYHDEKRDVCINPTLLVEVLSPSTEGYHRGAKWAQYQTIASLQTYVLVAQHEPRVEQYVRQSNNEWLLSTVAGMDGSLYLASIECTLALRDIYDRVEFPPAPAWPPF